VTFQDAYLNHLLIYFEKYSEKYTDFPMQLTFNWSGGNQTVCDIGTKIFTENKFIVRSICFPNFDIRSDEILNNIQIQDCIPALKKEFNNNVHVINMFHGPRYNKFFCEVGFSHITELWYTQQSKSIDIREIEKKPDTENKFIVRDICFPDYESGVKESYIQTYMIHDYFTQKNINIDLEHLS
tara:strand:+ start:524 stop:1072 length:549 start_codon:yes stop_codon:yes gene_type:complete